MCFRIAINVHGQAILVHNYTITYRGQFFPHVFSPMPHVVTVPDVRKILL